MKTLLPLLLALGMIGCAKPHDKLIYQGESSEVAGLRDESVESEIDAFRKCHQLYVQQPQETLAQFSKRLPGLLPDKACILLRKSCQRPPAEGLMNLFNAGGDLTITGGCFDPSAGIYIRAGTGISMWEDAPKKEKP